MARKLSLNLIEFKDHLEQGHKLLRQASILSKDLIAVQDQNRKLMAKARRLLDWR